MTSNYIQLVVSLPAPIVAQVRTRLDPAAMKGKNRNNTSGALAAALDRYYEGLRRERAILRPMFTPAECAALIALPRHYDAGLLWAVAQERDVALGRKLHTTLSYPQMCAILDALERWDIAPGDDPALLLA